MSPKASDTTEKKPRKAAPRTRTRKAATTGDAVTTESAAVEAEASPAPAPKRATTRRKKAVEETVATEVTPVAETAAPKKPARTRRKKAEPAEAEAAATTDETVEAKPAAKAPRRTTRKKAEPVVADKEEAAPTEVSPKETPVKKPRTRKAAVAKSADTETSPAPAAKKPTRRRSTKTEAKSVDEATVEDATEAHPLHVGGALDGIVEQDAEIHPPAAPAPVAEPAKKDVPEESTQVTFADLGLSEPLLRAVTEMGYVHPTPIQAQAIPSVLHGQDVLGVAQTGTGKTASFTLPMLEILSGSRARARMPRSLILEPTRELALQVAENFVNYGKHLKLTHALLIGGESMADQKEVLNKGVDVLIATPGRLLDLFERGGLLLTQTRILVIDEADRMLDMGFIPDIERIVGLLPANRQTLFFSATMAPEIRRLADAFLQSPKQITVSRPSTVATTIETGLIVVDEDDKRKVLRKLLRAENLQNAIVFCNRKRDVDILLKSLLKHGFSAGALHGDLPQSVRFQTLEKFKSGELKILVCSDVAARGIDIGGLSHVFNFDLPFHAEDYVHRIGRTGRAGKEGKAYSLATPYDRKFAEAIETLTGKPIPRLERDGITQLDWASEEESRGSRGKKKRTGRGSERERDNERPKQSEAPARKKEVEKKPATPVEATPQAEAREDRRGPRDRNDRNDRNRRDDNRRRGSEIADAPGENVLGFGTDVPNFMKLPRRVPVAIEATGEDGTES
ncbi:DEAD/DEAH box helicase [Acetobacter sicerae]|uniref:DEAD/DEAH box helicase n=1 Tax=Acetobacter sicerae TaxID=85325 RepID=UPI00156BBF94|nr:DEAD/DEAH box helicase [Acetobacter sicerae]NHN92213.1 DEAD/DEAH box helicase [Acetobacter sicerae]